MLAIVLTVLLLTAGAPLGAPAPIEAGDPTLDIPTSPDRPSGQDEPAADEETEGPTPAQVVSRVRRARTELRHDMDRLAGSGPPEDGLLSPLDDSFRAERFLQVLEDHADLGGDGPVNGTEPPAGLEADTGLPTRPPTAEERRVAAAAAGPSDDPAGVEDLTGYAPPPVPSLELSGHHDARGPITIVGDDGYLSCGCVREGTGTADDPYVISGWEILLTDDATGVTILDTRAHAVVEDNVIHRAGQDPPKRTQGFWLHNATNITLADNLVQDVRLGIQWDVPDRAGASNGIIERNRIGRMEIGCGSTSSGCPWHTGLQLHGPGFVIRDNLVDATAADFGAWNGQRFFDPETLSGEMRKVPDAVVVGNTFLSGETTRTLSSVRSRDIVFEDNAVNGLAMFRSDGSFRNNTLGALSVIEGPSIVEDNRFPGHLGHPWGGGLFLHGENVTARDNRIENLTRGTGIMVGGEDNVVVDNRVTVRGWDPDVPQKMVDPTGPRPFVGLDVVGQRALVAGNAIIHAPLDVDKPFWVLQREVNWGLMANPRFPTQGVNTIRDNHVRGFLVGIANVVSHNNTWEGNRVEDATWSLVFAFARHQTFRNNTFTGSRYGFQLHADVRPEAEHDIDTSNTINGRPMLHRVVDDGRDLTFDGDDRQYEYIGLVGAGNVTLRDMTMRRSADRILLLDVGNVTIEDNRFGDNLVAVAVHRADHVTARNNTFLDDWVALWLDRTLATVEANDMLSSVPPGWDPSMQGWVGVLLRGDEAVGSVVANNTFENHIAPLQMLGTEEVRIEDNEVAGAGFALWMIGADRAVVRGNRIDWTAFGILDLRIGDGVRIVDNEVTRASLVGIFSTYRPAALSGNLVTTSLFGIWLGDARFTSFPAVATIERNTVLADNPRTGWVVGIITSLLSHSDRLDDTTHVRDNVVHPGRQGIGIWDQHIFCSGDDTYRATNNTVVDGYAGFGVFCEFHYDTDEPGHHRFRDNRIVGNRFGVIHRFENGNASLDVRGNWWGDASGPHHPDDNPDGTGDPVTSNPAGYVEFEPWLTSPPSQPDVLPVTLDIERTRPASGRSVALEVATVDGTPIERASFAPGEQVWPVGLTGDGSDTIAFDHTFHGPGPRPVVATVEGSDGRVGLARLTVDVRNVAPQLDPHPVGDAVIGEPTRIDVDHRDPDGYPVQAVWDLGDGTERSVDLTGSAGDTGQASAGGTPTLGPPVPTAATARDPASWHEVVEPGDGRTVLYVRTTGPAAAYADRVRAGYGPVLSTYDVVDALAAYVPDDRVDTLEAEPWVSGTDPADVDAALALQTTGDVVRDRPAVDLGVTGDGVGVAVLDTGVNATHPDLDDRITHQYRSEGAGPDTIEDHGTFMAGVLAGTGEASDGLHTGMAPGVDIIDRPIADHAGELTTGRGQFNAALGRALFQLDWIAEHHEEHDIRVIYTGINFVCYPKGCVHETFKEALDRVVDLGIVVVAPAGNFGSIGGRPANDTINQPAVYDSVIGVGAVDDKNTRSLDDVDLATWSGRGGPGLGDKPDVVAPGVHVAAPDWRGGYRSASGTSIAAAHVAGVAALMTDKDPSLSPAEIESVLESTARKVPADTGPTPNPGYGWGLVDAEAALSAVGGGAPLAPTHVYDEPGRYDVTVNVTDNLGAATQASTEIVVHGVLPDLVVEDVPQATVPTQFHDNSTALPDADLSYAWTFDGNATATGPDPTHTFEEPGSHDVTLTVTEHGYGAWTVTETIEVLEAPDAAAEVLMPRVDAKRDDFYVVADEEVRLRGFAGVPADRVRDATLFPHGLDGPAQDATHSHDHVWIGPEISYETLANHTVAFRYRDAATNETHTAFHELRVRANRAPTARIDAPPDGLAVDAAAPEVPLDGSGSGDRDGHRLRAAWHITGAGWSEWTWLGMSWSPPPVTWSPPHAGRFAATLHVTDPFDAQDAANVSIAVDDAVAVEAGPAPGSARITPAERAVAETTVTDVAGEGVAGATVRFDVVHVPTGTSSGAVSATTDVDGRVRVALPYDIGSGGTGVNLAGEHRVTVSVEAPNRFALAGDDGSGPETATATFAFDVVAV